MSTFELNKVIVADPSPFMGKLLQGVLYAFGIPNAILCADQEEAWSLLSQDGCDCLVTDWFLPPLASFSTAPTLDLVTRLRTSPSSHLRTMPVLLCTGRTQMKEIVAARDAGVTEILSKPVSVQQILLKLKSTLKQPRPFVAAENFRGPDRRRRGGDWQGPERRHRLTMPQAAIDHVMEGIAA